MAVRYPSHGEAVDLIRLLVDHKCTTLVSVNPLTEVPYVSKHRISNVDLCVLPLQRENVDFIYNLPDDLLRRTLKQ